MAEVPMNDESNVTSNPVREMSKHDGGGDASLFKDRMAVARRIMQEHRAVLQELAR